MQNDNFSGEFHGKKAKIKVIGVGGGGGNAVNRMVQAGIQGVDFIALNTDAQDLKRNLAPYRVQIGENLTKGLGVGGDPDRGYKAAEESREQIQQIVNDADLLFVTAGMGGGTGTGAAPVAARTARETGGEDTLIIGVVTRPFNFEGFIRLSQAEAGIKEMRKYVDTLLVIPNENLYGIIQRNTSTKQAYRMADEVLRQAIQGISEVITTPGDVNVDFNDVKRIMTQSGEALIGMGSATGEKRHIEAAQAAITSPMLENADLDGAKGLIVHFLAKEHLAFEQKEVIDYIRANASKDAIIMYGLVEDETMADELKITVIATGFPGDRSQRMRRLKSRERVTMTPDFNNSGTMSDSAQSDDNILVPAFIRKQKGV